MNTFLAAMPVHVQTIGLDDPRAALCLLGAVYFIFRS